MKSFKLSLVLLLVFGSVYGQDLALKDLTIEHKKNPAGIDVLQPRFSWKISGKGNDILQTAYSIRVATDQKFSSAKTVWKSGKISSDESVLLTYDGPSLKSGQKYFWQVRIWDNKGKESKWSETAYWEMGLLSPSDWKAKWIEMEGDTNRYSPSPHFRREFSITKKVSYGPNTR